MKGMLCETVDGMLLQATDTSAVPHPSAMSSIENLGYFIAAELEHCSEMGNSYTQ